MAVPPPDVLIGALVAAARAWADPEHPRRAAAVEQTLAAPNRFTEEAVAFAVNQQMRTLRPRALERWQGGRRADEPAAVGVLNAGNVPLAGLQDLVAVLLAGHRYRGSVSSKSPALLPAFVDEVRARLPQLPVAFVEADEAFAGADAVIATGTDETRAWAEARCDALGIATERRLLRGHRVSAAVLDGQETADEREGLAEDVLLHEGLGCRNVAVVWAPRSLDADPYFESFAQFRSVFPPHADTPGALKMQQAFLEALGLPHAYGDGLEFLVSRGEPDAQAPGHLRWVPYDDVAEAEAWLEEQAAALQLVVARPDLTLRVPEGLERTAPGDAQRPRLDWCPDGVDTLAWLAGL